MILHTDNENLSNDYADDSVLMELNFNTNYLKGRVKLLETVKLMNHRILRKMTIKLCVIVFVLSTREYT